MSGGAGGSDAIRRRSPATLPLDPTLGTLPARLRFRLYKFLQPVGEESAEVDVTAGSVRVRIDFAFSDRGERVPLRGEFRGASDLTPQHFEVEGRNARQSELRESVSVRAGTGVLRVGGSTREVPVPPTSFTISGYAPVTMQMLLLRYWKSHGEPEELATLPRNSVRIARRGTDTVRQGDTVERLERFSLDGLTWGREWVWLDPEGTLVALVTTDAEADRFEAVREGYAADLGRFIGWAGTDGMEALHALAVRLVGHGPTTWALVHGRLVDGTGSSAFEDATVVVHDGRILAAGPADRVPVPAEAEALDVRGCTVLPGLWDMHAHFQQVEWGPIYLAAGVTTVRDCGNEFEFVTTVRDAIEGGRGLGPRLLAAGIVDGEGPLAVGIARVESVEDAERWVERYHAARFQQIKVYSSMKLDAVRAVAAAAHRRGMTVTGHVPVGLTAYDVVRAGQDQINHIPSVAAILADDLPPRPDAATLRRQVAEIDLAGPTARAGIEFLREHGTVVDPTLALLEMYTFSTEKPAEASEPGTRKIAPELAGRLRHPPDASDETRLLERFFRKCVDIVGALHRAGIPLVAGTDQAVPGHSLHRELELYVEAGLTPLEAIRTATAVPARVLGLSDEAGTIGTGKTADLLVVRGDPLRRIRDVRNVVHVVARGVRYDPAPLWRSVGFLP